MAEKNELLSPKIVVGQDYAMKTVSDLSTKQFCFVKLDTNNLLVAAAAGEPAVGILQNFPDGSVKADYGDVRVFGVSQLTLGGNVSQGDKIKVTTGAVGLATVVDHDRYCAIAMSDASNGDVALVLIQHGTVSA